MFWKAGFSSYAGRVLKAVKVTWNRDLNDSMCQSYSQPRREQRPWRGQEHKWRLRAGAHICRTEKSL